MHGNPRKLITHTKTHNNSTNMKIFHLISLFFLIFQSLYSSVSASETPSFYNQFIECLTTTTTNPISKEKVSKIVYEPNNEMFKSVLNAYVRNRRYNTSSSPQPVAIVAPLHESHVPAVVVCAKTVGVPIKTRSGGHDYEGLSYVAGSEYIILDMFNLRTIEVDMGSLTAWVQAGANLGELYYRIAEKSPIHGFPGGSSPTVGIGGTISGGGYGNMIRAYGLTVDHVVDARIVDVKGRVLNRKEMGEDLFWAIRGGGGGSFGVILAYKIELVQVPKMVTHFQVERTLDEHATNVVSEYQQAVTTMDRNLFIRLIMRPIPDPQNQQRKTIKLTAMGLFLGESAKLRPIMTKEIPSLALKSSDCKEMTWIQSVLQWSNYDHTTTKPEILLARVPDRVEFTKQKSDYVMTPLAKEAIQSLWKKMTELGDIELKFSSYGGKIAEIADDETPFPHRSGVLYNVQYVMSWSEEGSEPEMVYQHQARELYKFMTPFVSANPRRAYLNYRDIDLGTTDHGSNRYAEAKAYGTKYFMNNFDRLVKVKTVVDPDNFFRNAQSIPPGNPTTRSRKQANL